MTSRREVLARAACASLVLAPIGLLVPPAVRGQQPSLDAAAAFEAKSVAELYKALGMAPPVPSGDLTLTAPDIAENGAVVPVAATTTLPNVQKMLFYVEKNATVLAAMYDISESMDPSISTRIKMSQTSNVYALALTADGKGHVAEKEVKVTLGGCGG